jgi:phosphatidylglycerophosphate synthase
MAEVGSIGGSDSRARLRARVDAGAAVLVSVVVGVVLTTLIQGELPARFLAGTAGVVFVTVAAVSILRRQPAFSTVADRITLFRSVLAGGCTTLVALSFAGALPMRSWPLVLVAVPALLLDVVDGWAARKKGTASAQGARLDMEVDAALLLVLSIPAAIFIGPWVLAIGAMRYLFIAASWMRPALRQPLRFSRSRKVAGGFQGVVLVVALTPVVPVPVAALVLLVALALLVVSFGRDVWELERSHGSAAAEEWTGSSNRRPRQYEMPEPE